MAQPLRPWGCRTQAQNGPKNTKNAFFTCFWAYVGQSHGHIGLAASMPFASINPTKRRTNPWNFHKNILRIGDFEKLSFFWVGHFGFFFQKKKKKICFIPMKISQTYFAIKDGSKFWWLPWFPAKNHSTQTFQSPV